jgi:hypothetical protein
MRTAADQLDDTSLPTDLQQFVYLANNGFELLETAKRERDREAALATVSSILQGRRLVKVHPAGGATSRAGVHALKAQKRSAGIGSVQDLLEQQWDRRHRTDS